MEDKRKTKDGRQTKDKGWKINERQTDRRRMKYKEKINVKIPVVLRNEMRHQYLCKCGGNWRELEKGKTI